MLVSINMVFDTQSGNPLLYASATVLISMEWYVFVFRILSIYFKLKHYQEIFVVLIRVTSEAKSSGTGRIYWCSSTLTAMEIFL